ncbi:MAG: type II toxin-antitoxin system VapC family toxin [Candidatus Peregrinibacteria bacterium]
MTLIDTDIFIWAMRGNLFAQEFLDSVGDMCISDISYMELLQGTRSKQEMIILKKTLEEMQVERIPVNREISQKATEIVEAFTHSHALHVADICIAATALFYNIPLATGNKKHFLPIPSLRLIPFSPQ